MKRPSLLTLIDQKPLKMVTLAPLPPAPVRKTPVNRPVTAVAANSEASPARNGAAVLVVAFVFWAVYFLMNRLGA